MADRDGAQARVQAAIDQRVASGAEVGMQVAVVRHGEVVVDAVGGVADPASGQAVAPDTLFWAASTANGVAIDPDVMSPAETAWAAYLMASDMRPGDDPAGARRVFSERAPRDRWAWSASCPLAGLRVRRRPAGWDDCTAGHHGHTADRGRQEPGGPGR